MPRDDDPWGSVQHGSDPYGSGPHGNDPQGDRNFLVMVGGRPIRYIGQWVFPHANQTDVWESALSILGAIMVGAAVVVLLVEHFTHVRW